MRYWRRAGAGGAPVRVRSAAAVCDFNAISGQWRRGRGFYVVAEERHSVRFDMRVSAPEVLSGARIITEMGLGCV